MPDPVILGTIGLDTIETPFGKRERILGGSAVYASFAASFFAKPGMVSIAGNDLPNKYEELLKNKGIDLAGVERRGKTFAWEGYYEYDMSEAKTRKTELNSLMDFSGNVPEAYKDAQYLFLANVDPEIQLTVHSQLRPKLTILDTMNFWIESKKDILIKAIGKADILIINDGEARMLFGTPHLVKAAKEALTLGPAYIIIKKGEHGALLFSKGRIFSAPGYPLEDLIDPTGCGDTFGGAIVGWLAKTKDHSEQNLRKAIVYASALASFNAQDFSLNRMKALSMGDIDERVQSIRKMREF
ncbi:TPA: sugar kinase [Candidatus Woesearchaeota archaeon]|nr:sugar kinase [Candidatus Woesearchaeota archaeon]HII69548.1 sugar kinase [Candidatus Woesearchaeota archaeon]